MIPRFNNEHGQGLVEYILIMGIVGICAGALLILIVSRMTGIPWWQCAIVWSILFVLAFIGALIKLARQVK